MIFAYFYGEPDKSDAVIGQLWWADFGHQSIIGGRDLEGRKTGHIGRLLGGSAWVRGVINNDFVELNDVPEDLVERIALTPAAGLGSTRDKPDSEYCEKIFRSFQKNNVKYFFYIRRQRFGLTLGESSMIWPSAKGTSCARSTSPRQQYVCVQRAATGAPGRESSGRTRRLRAPSEWLVPQAAAPPRIVSAGPSRGRAPFAPDRAAGRCPP